MGDDLGSVDALRILFRQPVCFAKSILAEPGRILADIAVVDGFGLCLVCVESADNLSGAEIPVRSGQMAFSAAVSSDCLCGHRPFSADDRRVFADAARLSARTGICELPGSLSIFCIRQSSPKHTDLFGCRWDKIGV